MNTTEMVYQDFLQTKKKSVGAIGKDIDAGLINPMLFEFQRDIVHWAVKMGRCAVFADTGLGKTYIQRNQTATQKLSEIKKLVTKKEHLKFRRRAMLIELKPSYFRIAVENLKTMESQNGQDSLFANKETP